MKIDRVVVGQIKTNCWLVEGQPKAEGEPAQVIVIDPGDEPETILNAVGERKVAGVLLTHGHFDHILAADEVADESSSFLYISEAEADALPMLCDDICERYGVDFEPPRVDFKLKDGDVLELAGLKLRVFLTPGHTPGSTGYLITEPESNLIHYFSGDTIFARDLGRTDLVGGDPAVLEKSLEKIAQLPDDTIIYPGHGPTTTIERESAHSYWPR